MPFTAWQMSPKLKRYLLPGVFKSSKRKRDREKAERAAAAAALGSKVVGSPASSPSRSPTRAPKRTRALAQMEVAAEAEAAAERTTRAAAAAAAAGCRDGGGGGGEHVSAKEWLKGAGGVSMAKSQFGQKGAGRCNPTSGAQPRESFA